MAKLHQLKIRSMVKSVGKKKKIPDTIRFDAYLTDMSQTFDSTWNTVNVFGRNDPIATFQGTQRTISLALDVPSANEDQANKNLQKCGRLATFLYPGYNKVSHIPSKNANKAAATTDPVETAKYMSRPPLVKIQFANIINGPGGGLLGFISSYSFNPVLEAGMFNNGTRLFPRTISISIGFTVLHQTELGFESDASGSVTRLGRIPFF
jgi:hypothetical protein